MGKDVKRRGSVVNEKHASATDELAKLMMQKLKSMFLRLSGFRISVLVAMVFVVGHVLIEANMRGGGFFSERGFLFRLEYAMLDQKFQWRGNTLFEPQVVIAKMDETSVDRYGLLPWNRTIKAQLIDALVDYDVKVIGFDEIYSEEDRNSSFQELRRFKDVYDSQGLYRPSQPAKLGEVEDSIIAADNKLIELQQDRDKRRPLDPKKKRDVDLARGHLSTSKSALQSYKDKSEKYYEVMSAKVRASSPDEALAASIAKARDRIVLGYFSFRHQSEVTTFAKAQLEANFERIKKVGITEVSDVEVNAGSLSTRPRDVRVDDLEGIYTSIAVQAPLPVFANAARYFGFFNVEPDPDGIIRRELLVQRINGLILPSLTVQCAAAYFGGDFVPVGSPINSKGIDGVMIYNSNDPENSPFIGTDPTGQMFINYPGDPQTVIPGFSAVDIIERKVPKESLKGKIVIVGATAIGTFDLRASPFSAAMPGVYVHAATMQNIIDKSFLNRWSGLAALEGVILLVIGLLAGMVLPKVRIGLGALYTIGFIILLAVVDQKFVFGNGYWMRSVAPILEMLSIFVSVAVYRYMTEEKEKRIVKNAFQFYLTKSVVDAVLKDTSRLKLGGEKKEMSVLFSDIRGFTTISERVTPEELVLILNGYLTPMTDLVFQHEGTLDKYMGDAVMAFWGAPIDQKDHAKRACQTALDMLAKLALLQAEWREQGLPEIDIGVGINSGPMVVGNMGSKMRFDYTVMGDNVNLGSRLEGINKEYGTNIIISQYTYEQVKNDVYVRELDAVRVKGKHEPVYIYELRGMGRPSGKEDEFIRFFETGIQQYRGQKWDESIATFRKAMELYPTDYCAQKYIERCESMKLDPPGEGWDGVYTMKTK